MAPGLLRASSSSGPLGRLESWVLDKILRRVVEVVQILEWRRLAPGGSPLWVIPDRDLEVTIDRLASSSRARTVELTYYLAEFERRERRRLNEQLAQANRQMVLLTRVVLVLTAVLVLLGILSTILVVA